MESPKGQEIAQKIMLRDQIRDWCQAWDGEYVEAESMIRYSMPEWPDGMFLFEGIFEVNGKTSNQHLVGLIQPVESLEANGAEAICYGISADGTHFMSVIKAGRRDLFHEVWVSGRLEDVTRVVHDLIM
jgi:hypothetical protein